MCVWGRRGGWGWRVFPDFYAEQNTFKTNIELRLYLFSTSTSISRLSDRLKQKLFF